MSVEECNGALPGELRCGGVVAGRGIVVEPVLNARIDESFIADAIGL
jgi:hypothetical protein